MHLAIVVLSRSYHHSSENFPYITLILATNCYQGYMNIFFKVGSKAVGLGILRKSSRSGQRDHHMLRCSIFVSYLTITGDN